MSTTDPPHEPGSGRSTGDAAAVTTGVLEGLGWPAAASTGPSTGPPTGRSGGPTGHASGPSVGQHTGLGWPQPRQDRDASGGYPQGDPRVDAEPAPPAVVPEPVVSRETTAADLAPSRFGPHPAPGTPYRTAADVADAALGATVSGVLAGGAADDLSTPLAASVGLELARRHGASAEPLPRPRRTRVMVVANQKGGVGKTTTTVNVAAALAQQGQRVLVVDLDPQGNASTALSVDHHRGTPSTYDALVDGVALAEVVQPSPEVDGLFVVPATIDLAGAEIELVSLVAREGRLRKAVHGHPLVFGEGEDRLDYVLIDCPPSLGLLTLNALVAGDEMLIPIQAEYYALEGLGQLLETVEMVKAHLNPQLWVSTILLTMYDARTRLSAGVAEEVRRHFGAEVLRTSIPRSVRISEAPSYGQTVMTYDPGSAGAMSYREAAREMAGRLAGPAKDAGGRP
jgi:chromosome partitioning protein